MNLIDQPWLPPAPPGYRLLCRQLLPDAAELSAQVKRLGNVRLGASEASLLTKALRRVVGAGGSLNDLMPVTVNILPSGTFDIPSDSLPAIGVRHGLLLQPTLLPTDQIEQQVLTPSSILHRAPAHFTLLAIDHIWLGLDRLQLDEGAGHERVEAAFLRLKRIQDAIRSTGSTLLAPTIPAPQSKWFGSLDRGSMMTPRAMIDEFNRKLIGLGGSEGLVVLDVASLAESIGTALWFDQRQYDLYKAPFSLECVPIYCDWVARLIGALRGRSRKCLVLDLDNTVWGGVVGDDGMDGLRLGPGSAEGESFVAIQHMALALRSRGILLAVCSKNDDEVARQPFRAHPEMLIRESDIAVFQANWKDKANNIEAIAKTLSIGLDALVLLDDNPVEREAVRRALPDVRVPELPTDPSLFPSYILSAGYFESASFSQEDRQRVASYAGNAQRAEVLSRTLDLGDYLTALDMCLTVKPFDPIGRARISQLINKSNQYNLTSKRYSESDVAAFEAAAGVYTQQARLKDSFSDFGMIGVVIAKPLGTASAAWLIDTWLMSCRVMGRRVEEGMLASLVRAARSQRVQKLIGQYIRSAKNGMVEDHYLRLGFQRVENSSLDGAVYELEIAGYNEPALPFSGLLLE